MKKYIRSEREWAVMMAGIMFGAAASQLILAGLGVSHAPFAIFGAAFCIVLGLMRLAGD